MYSQTWLYRILLLAIFLFLYVISSAQFRWDGEGEDGQWTTAANWAGDVVPGNTDDVLLDNSMLPGDYIVSLPSGTNVVIIQTLTISPLAGNTIEVVLPNTNTVVPAFEATGPGYGLLINDGGIFRNASGASSGAPLVIADSIRINNGGRFVQNTRRSHAANVTVLSKASGTEEGIFEFDIPNASTTVSLSNRTFGILKLTAVAAGGTVTYTATGTNPVKINSDLVIDAGVSFSLHFSDTMFISRDLVHAGGFMNLGNNNRSLVTVIKRNLSVSPGSSIGKTGSSIFPIILLNGNNIQDISVEGTIIDSITLKVNNPAGITLQSPLSLPYILDLTYGKVYTSSTNLLTMKTGSTIIVDSISNTGFINGPVKVESLDATEHYLVPVGKEITMRWIALKNATGNFIVEFFKSNPQSISQIYNTGVHHISGLEYWAIQADATPAPSAAIELSFTDPNSGGVTDLSALRIAQFNGIGWDDAGNITVTGTAGSGGSVTGNSLTTFNPAGYFTLASSSAANPLPVKVPRLNGTTAPSTNRNRQLLSVNPTVINATANVKITGDETGIVKMEIFNTQGQLIKTQVVKVNAGLNSIPLNVHGLAAGFYWLRLTNNKNTTILQFIKR